jgi:hypothetical protein
MTAVSPQESAVAVSPASGRRAPRSGVRPGDRSHKSINQPLTRFRLLTAAVRLLPDFIIIGAQKAGTSSLYRYLADHPLIEPAVAKEVHYFDWHFHRGASWYRAHFPTVAARWRSRMQGRPLLTGEASPYYLFHPHAPQRVKALVPGAKLIVLLRDPVERTISAYHHQVRAGTESLSIAEALARESDRLSEDIARLAVDASHRGFAHRRFSYMARSVYAGQLEAWLRLFPREQLLILRSEDFFERPADVFAAVLQYLGLPAARTARFPRFNAAEYDDVDPAVRAELTRYFAPHNQRLYTLLGRDFGWAR